MSTKVFSLGVVLTVTTGRFLVDDIGDLYDLLNHMTGDNLFTHQLPRAGEACQGALLAQHPQLKDVVVPDLSTADGYRHWLAGQEQLFGAELPVEPLESWRHKDAMAELSEMAGDDSRIIPVIAP